MTSTSIRATILAKQITSDDFNLDSNEKISLKIKDCIIILFYIDNKESSDLLQIWLDVSSKNSGAVMGECNLNVNSKIQKAFLDIKGDCNHPFNWASIASYPFILTFRGGWPQAFYNGNRDSTNISNYILLEACTSCYTEKDDKFKGVTINIGENKEIQGRKIFKQPDTSSDFNKETFTNYKDLGVKIEGDGKTSKESSEAKSITSSGTNL